MGARKGCAKKTSWFPVLFLVVKFLQVFYSLFYMPARLFLLQSSVGLYLVLTKFHLLSFFLLFFSESASSWLMYPASL